MKKVGKPLTAAVTWRMYPGDVPYLQKFAREVVKHARAVELLLQVEHLSLEVGCAA